MRWGGPGVGGLFGEMALIDGGPRSACGFRPQGDPACRHRPADLRPHANEVPDFAIKVMQLMARRLRAAGPPGKDGGNEPLADNRPPRGPARPPRGGRRVAIAATWRAPSAGRWASVKSRLRPLKRFFHPSRAGRDCPPSNCEPPAAAREGYARMLARFVSKPRLLSISTAVWRSWRCWLGSSWQAPWAPSWAWALRTRQAAERFHPALVPSGSTSISGARSYLLCFLGAGTRRTPGRTGRSSVRCIVFVVVQRPGQHHSPRTTWRGVSYDMVQTP